MLEPFRVVVTAQDGEAPTQAATTPLTLADLDGLIDMLRSQSQSQPSDSWYFLVLPKRYYQLQRSLRYAQKHAGTIAQKKRAQWKRRHREQKQARAALAVQYRRR